MYAGLPNATSIQKDTGRNNSGFKTIVRQNIASTIELVTLALEIKLLATEYEKDIPTWPDSMAQII
jgi:hypothetical protein